MKKKKELVFATIYNAKFTDITVRESHLNKNLEYIMKQILFWAYIATYEDGTPMLSIYYVPYSGYNIKFNFSQYVDYGLEHSNQSKRYTQLGFDMINALGHYGLRNDRECLPWNDSVLKDMTNLNSSVTKNDANKIMEDIIVKLGDSIKDLSSDNKDITITQYNPASGNFDEYQRFVSIYVPGVSLNPPDPVVQKKYYATGISLDGGKTIDPIDQNFTDMKESNQSIIRPDKSSDYVYQGFSLYGSNSAEKPSSILPTGGVTVQYVDTTCNLNYNAAQNNYYLVVFVYKPKTYTLKYNYYCKSASESEYRYIGSGTPETHQRNANVSIPKTYPYDSTYNTTLYNTYSISTTVSNLSTAGDYINFDMPASDVTVNIYYQYGQVIKKYI